MQHRHPPFPRQLADRVEQGVGRPTARRELDPYHPGTEAADDLPARVGRIVGVHRDVAADHVGMLPPEREEGGIAGLHVTGGWEVDRRCPAPPPEDRGAVDRPPPLPPPPDPPPAPLPPTPPPPSRPLQPAFPLAQP